MAALVSLAVATASTVSLPAIQVEPRPPVGDVPAQRAHGPVTPRTEPGVQPGRWRTLWARLLTDHLVRNSLYLVLSSGVQAALGFVFWIIAARLFSAADVGIASSLITATALIAYLALLGLNSTLVRYLPGARDPDGLITAGLLLVALSGAGIALIYLLLTPAIAPRLAFVEHRPLLAIGFVMLTGAAAVNLLTDSIFIASRRADYAALTDGGIGGITKIVFAVALVGTGAYGLFAASVGGFAAAAVASLVLMITALRWRPTLRKPLRTLRPLLRFSAANYAGNVFSLLPTLVVPLIVLDRIGAPEAAYYFVAFQVATLLYAATYAVGQTFLAEGSHADEDWEELLRRSRRVLTALCLPGCLVLIAAAHWVLLAFGPRYSQNGTLCLILLVVAAIPIAMNTWLQTVLRLLGQLRPIVVSNGVYGVAICGLAWVLAPYGLNALTAAWVVGALLGTAAAAVPCMTALRHRRAAMLPRHRRTARTRSAPGASGPGR
jgi:O-antigen/teichoic acid export membrane protein